MLWLKTRTNAHRPQQSCGEKGMVRYSLKMRVLRPLLSRGERLGHSSWGERPNPCLDRLLLFFSDLTSKKDLLSITQNVVFYILGTIKEMKIINAEGKGGELALSLGKFTQALEITLKIGNNHLLFQTRVREFQQEQAITVWMHFLGLIPTGKPSLRVWLLPTTSLLSVFHTRLSHVCQI